MIPDRANMVGVTEVELMLNNAQQWVRDGQCERMIDPRHLTDLSMFYNQRDSAIPPASFKQTVRYYTAAVLMLPFSKTNADYAYQATALLETMVGNGSPFDARTQVELYGLLAQLQDRLRHYRKAVQAADQAMAYAAGQNDAELTASTQLLRGCMAIQDANDCNVRLRMLKEARRTLLRLSQRQNGLTLSQQQLLLNVYFALTNHYARYKRTWLPLRHSFYVSQGMTLKARMKDHGHLEYANWTLRWANKLPVPSFLPS